MLKPRLMALLALISCTHLQAQPVDIPYGGRVNVDIVKEQASTDDGHPIHYPSTDQPIVKTLRIHTTPGGETGWHYHPLPGYGYVLSGIMEVEMEDGRRNRYEAGEAIYEIVKTPHNGRCISSVPCDVIVFFTSEKGVPVTVMIPPMEE